MRTEDIAKAPASNWHPERNLEFVGMIGKLGEEASELASHCCRIVIQGVFANDPDTGQSNIRKLEDEIADVEACIALVKSRMGLDDRDIRTRVSAKFDYKVPWLDWLKDKRR
jgi:hypothetical protein